MMEMFQDRKPAGYQFTPGQATDLAINKPGMERNQAIYLYCPDF
jgi:hypothetical protein